MFFLKRAMQKAGINNPVYAVDSGQAVLDYLTGKGDYSERDKFPLPMLLLLDLKLPSLPGVEVLRWIRQDARFRTLPVVVVTSSTLNVDVDEAYGAGANAYAVKPADPDQMIQLMRDFSGWWLKQNVTPA